MLIMAGFAAFAMPVSVQMSISKEASGGLTEVLLCSHSPNDAPPVPQRNLSIAAERGAHRSDEETVKK